VGIVKTRVSPTLPRRSLYWDDFERRAYETVEALRNGTQPPVRRVAVFITDRCNFRCSYCNHEQDSGMLSEAAFTSLLEKYGDTALFHITGGEPSMVPWLYPLLRERGQDFRFHLNTNAFIYPPAESVKRLKISLDHWDAEQWDAEVGVTGAFKRVVENIKRASAHTVTSITFTMNHQNFREAAFFGRWAQNTFTDLYAIFYSVYKGTNPRYAFTEDDVETFFTQVKPAMEYALEPESLALLQETIDEKVRLLQGVRFPQNSAGTCYLSMSERVVDPSGEEFSCSHLYRDGIRDLTTQKHEKCLYGCNRRLTMFNELVEKELCERGEA